MNRIAPRALGSFALLAVALGNEPPATDWPGSWQGGLRRDTEWFAARADIREANGRIDARLTVRGLGLVDAPIEFRVEKETVGLAFDLAELGRLEIAARLEDGALECASGEAWTSPAIHLAKASELRAEDVDDFAGWYEIAEERRILVTRGSEVGLRFFSGEDAGTLVPVGGDRFVVAYNDLQPSPRHGKVRFVREAAGEVESLEFDDGQSPTIARRLRDHECAVESVSFRGAEIEFGGLLLRPKADRPVPAVVFLAGTGYSTADRFYEMALAERLLEKRIAVLLFDKRGCGASGGDWRTSSIADLADDAIAAVRFLRGRKEIEAKAIGLWGVSEGGWVAPLAASKCPDVAFLVNHGGPAVGPLEDEFDDLSAGIRGVGFEGEDLEIALALAAALVDFYGSAEARAPFEAALEVARKRPWWDRFQARIPQREDDWRVQWWRKRGRFDSLGTWKALRRPALVLIGSKDSTMDLAKNLEHFESFRSSNPSLVIRVVPGADHGLRVSGELVPGVVEGVAEWIAKLNRP